MIDATMRELMVGVYLLIFFFFNGLIQYEIFLISLDTCIQSLL